MTTRLLAILLFLSLSACASKPLIKDTRPAELVSELNAAEQAYQAGNYDQAEKQFSSVLKKSPNNIEAQFRLGNIALRQSNYADARRYYQQVLTQQKNSTKAHYNLALVNLLEAEQHFHFHTATSGEKAEQQTRLFALIDAIHTFLENDEPKEKPKTALDNLADLINKGTQ